MKTINDLVDHLNATFDYADFSISADNKQQFYYIFMTTITEYGELIEFNQQSKDWDIMPTLGTSNNEVQKEIMDFIYTTDSNHWFDGQKKKYNIIISENPILKVAVAYFKPNNDTSLKINESATQDDLKDGSYQFTDDEIEKLKKAGNSTFNQFVDLGKVEVKDEND